MTQLTHLPQRALVHHETRSKAILGVNRALAKSHMRETDDVERSRSAETNLISKKRDSSQTSEQTEPRIEPPTISISNYRASLFFMQPKNEVLLMDAVQEERRYASKAEKMPLTQENDSNEAFITIEPPY